MSENQPVLEYRPQHPLPQELQQMPRDDTVCKFCGVSYLIHSEMKALEERMKAALAQLEHYKGAVEREKLLAERLARSEADTTEIRARLEAETAAAAAAAAEAEAEAARREVAFAVRRAAVIKSAAAVSEAGRGLSAEVASVRALAAEARKAAATELQDLGEKMKAALSSLGQHHDQRVAELTSQLELSRSQATSDLEAAQSALAEKSRQVELITAQLTERERAREEAGAAVGQLKAENSRLHTELSQATSRISVLERTAAEAASSHKSALAELQGRLRDRQQAAEAAQARLEEARSQQQLAESSSVKSLDQIRQRAETAEERLQQLSSEREMMIRAHQARIEQLKESFKGRLTEADGWPAKLEAALADERQRSEVAQQELRERLDADWRAERAIQKEKNDELLRRTRREADEAAERLRRAVEAAERRAAELEARVQAAEAADSAAVRRAAEAARQAEAVRQAEAARQVAAERQRSEAALAQAREEIRMLQETVRRECEERFELTEALGQARQQLLSLHLPPSLVDSVGQAGEQRRPPVKLPPTDGAPTHPPQQPPLLPKQNAWGSSRTSATSTASSNRVGGGGSGSSRRRSGAGGGGGSESEGSGSGSTVQDIRFSAANARQDKNEVLAAKRRLAAIMAANREAARQ